MSNTNNPKASFGKRASLSSGNAKPQKTNVTFTSNGISIKVSHVSATKVSGHTRIDFESKRRKDSYRELNKKLGEG